MKNKFQRMTKQERKELVKEYRSIDAKNNSYISTLNRMLVLGIIGFIYGVLAILVDIFVLNVSVWTYIVDAIVMIFTVFLIVQRNRIFNAVMNDYAIKKTNGSAEKKDKKRKHVSKNAIAKKAKTKIEE